VQDVEPTDAAPRLTVLVAKLVGFGQTALVATVRPEKLPFTKMLLPDAKVPIDDTNAQFHNGLVAGDTWKNCRPPKVGGLCGVNVPCVLVTED